MLATEELGHAGRAMRGNGTAMRAKEMISIKFTVYGKPQGKARPRFRKYSKKPYTPETTVNYENAVKNAYVSAGGIYHDTAPIQIKITACFKKAKSNKMQTPTLKPDTDNIAKIVCDALNGIAYHDDKQITSLMVNKIWADDGIEKVVVEIEQIIHSR